MFIKGRFLLYLVSLFFVPGVELVSFNNTRYKLEKVVGSLKKPVHVTHDGVDPDLLYIVERHGVIKKFSKQKKETSVLLDISDMVYTYPGPSSESGLLYLAFHPKYKDNNRFFIFYTEVVDGRMANILAEYSLSGNTPEFAGKILTIPQSHDSHNGSSLMFDNKGYLYITTGDGITYQNYVQQLNNVYGKVLRIDVDRKSGNRPYSIPEDNPFKSVRRARGEIWAYGFRNPWRASIDPETQTIILGDVGFWKYEEINIVKKARNYGWPVYEGPEKSERYNQELDEREDPVHYYKDREYIEDANLGMNSVIGGVIYRGKELPELYGSYIYSDWAIKKIWKMEIDLEKGRMVSNETLLKSEEFVVSINTDPEGEILIVGFGRKIRGLTTRCSIYKLVAGAVPAN